MATVAEQIQEIYIGLLGRAADKAGLDYWADQIATNGLTQDDVRANFVSSQPEYAAGLGAMSRPAAVTELYDRLFARAPEAAGLEYWVNGAGSTVSADALVVALVTGAGTGDRAVLASKVEVANYYTDNNPLVADYNAAEAAAAVSAVDGSAKSVEDAKAVIDGDGVTMALTTSQDALTGTDKADTFNAFIFDNKNTAQSGDSVDGGGGNDRLYADVGTSQGFAVTLHTDSVEQLAVRAVAANNQDSTDNNLVSGVQIDAERMEGTTWYETNNSRADVIIEDVRIERKAAYGDDTDQITRDVTVAMVSTDPGNVDLGVYFDQHSLVKQGDAVSNSITMTVANPLEVSLGFDPLKPLEDIPYTFVRFTVDGTDVQFALDLTAVETYDQMFAALQTAFATEKTTNTLLADVNLTRSVLTDDFISRDGQARSADEYVLTSEGGKVGVALVGWGADGGLPSNNAFSATVKPGDVSTTSNLITSTVILDDVGRGSMGGDLVIGGLSIGDTSNSKGVEQFDITVERSSQLQEIQSTNNTLEEVYIKNGAVKGNLVVAGSTNTTASADDVPGVEGNAGFTDVRVVDATGMTGSVSINAELTGDVVAKYLNRTDVGVANADNSDFMYKLGAGSDSLSLNISNANLLASGSASREDFALTIEGNGGNDRITTMIGNGAGNDTTPWYENQKLNNNLSVAGGEGDDTISTVGAGNFRIDAGNGNDTVYTDNSGTKGSWVVNATAATSAAQAVEIAADVTFAANLAAEAATSTIIVAASVAAAVTAAKVVTAASAQSAAEIAAMDAALDTAALVAGASTTSIYDALVAAAPATISSEDVLITRASTLTGTANALLVGAKLTVTYAGAAANSVIGAVATAGAAGYESTIDIVTTDAKGNELSLVQAIKNAINNDSVLNKLLVAQDGTGGTLSITSKIDGLSAATDLKFDIAAATSLSAGDMTAVKLAWNDVLNTSNAVISDAAMLAQLVTAATAATAALGANGAIAQHLGSESTATSDNAVKMGGGNDVIVLGTNVAATLQSNDRIVFENYNQGDDTIVNFLETGANADVIDFSFYLGKNGTSVSSSSNSFVPSAQVKTTAAVTAADNLVGNETVIQTGFVATGAQTWANMTASDYAGAINNASTTAYGNIVATIDATAANVANQFGDKTSIVMLENNANAGEYKIFELTSTDASNLEFTSVKLVGTVDFGDSITTAVTIA